MFDCVIALSLGWLLLVVALPVKRDPNLREVRRVRPHSLRPGRF